MRRVAVIALLVLGSCREDRTPLNEMAASERLCAHVISLESREDADRLVAGASGQISEDVLQRSLYVLRTESQLTLVGLGSTDSCVAANLPIEIPVGTLSASATWMSAEEVQRLATSQHAFRANEDVARQCVVIAQLHPDRSELSDADQLYSFGATAFRGIGLLDAQAESANGITYLASESSCEAVLAVVNAASPRLGLGEQRVQARVCDDATLRACGYPNRIN